MAKKKSAKKSVKKTVKKSAKPVKKSVSAAKKKMPAKKASPIQKTTAKKTTVKKAAKPAAATPKSASFAVGTSLPDFSAEGTSGHHFKLSEHRGQAIVLYFYPKDSTPGCTIEGHDFTRLLPEFQNAGATVYGVSRDSLKSHENFKSKECLGFELLSDVDETLCHLFDVIKEKNMYGRLVMGIERSTFVIDANGRLVAEWRGVKVPGHAEEVLSKVQSLS